MPTKLIPKKHALVNWNANERHRRNRAPRAVSRRYAVAMLMVAACNIQAATAADYLNYNALTANLRAMASTHSDACRMESIGKSREGRDIWMLKLGRGSKKAERVALAIVAGIDGDFPVSTQVAVGVAGSLLAGEEGSAAHKLLAERLVYVIPLSNPDAAQTFFATPKREQRRALRPWDDDRDGSIDEDGPDDLNGDGLITMMRVLVDASHVSELEPTHATDPKESRLLKKADAAKGEKPVYAVFVEGLDDDGDGRYNEDGIGGVDLNRNFMHEFKEHGEGAGPYAISEPESKTLIDFFLTHSHIAAAIFYGQHDNIVDPPSGGKGGRKAKKPPASASSRGGGRGTGRFRRPPRPTPPKGFHKDDAPIYKHISKEYKKLTGIKKVPSAPAAGAMFAWAYAQYGIPSFACRVWTRPEPEKEKKKDGDAKKDDADEDNDKSEASDAEKDESDAPPGRHGRRGRMGRMGKMKGKGGKGKDDDGPSDKEAAAWLKYSDKHRDGAGFVPWTAFEHPQLGSVEIGGFAPFFRTTPPADLLDELSKKQADFVLDIGARLPKLSLVTPSVTRLSDSVFQIETSLRNDGYFPSGLAIAKQNKRVRPVVVTLDVPLDRVIGGQRVTKIWSVAGGGQHKLRWVVLGESGSVVPIKMTSEKYGDTMLEVTLSGDVATKEGHHDND